MKSIVVFLWLIIGGIIIPQHRVIYVNAGANPGGNGTLLNPFNTINQGIQSSVFGDTVHVMAGIYNEKIRMLNGVSLVGDGPEKCVINDSLMETQISDSCVISGLTFNQSISCLSVSPIIKGNNIHSKAGYLPGIKILSHSSPVIKQNYISSCEVGINILSECNPLIRNNIIIKLLMRKLC